MRAKTILTALFLISLAVAVVVILRAMPTQGDANANTPKEEILVATVHLAAGTLLRAQDVTWQLVNRPVEPGQIVRPSEGARQTKPGLDEETRGDLVFRRAVLPPGAGGTASPVPTGGAAPGLLSPGDRVDVTVTQNFRGGSGVIARRSVSETVVENLRVLAIDGLDAKAPSGGG